MPALRPTLRDARVICVSGCLAGLGAVLLTLVEDAGHPTLLPWWALAVLCALCEAVILRIQVHREGHAISLSELGVVLGLFFGSPGGFLIGRLAGSLAVFVLWRRQAPVKVVFNGALFFADSTLALVIFQLICGPDEKIGPLSWAAALLATTSCAILSTGGVTAVIALVDGHIQRDDVARELLRGVTNAAWVSVVALVAAYALSADVWAVVPLAVSIGLLLRGYRLYSALCEQHLSLERLYRFSHAVGSSPEVDDVLTGVLEHAHELLRADYAEIVFVSSDTGHQPLRVSSLADGAGLRRTRLREDEITDPIWTGVLKGVPLLVPRGSRPGREFLRRHGIKDAVLTPLRGDSGIVGTIMVGDRMGDVRTFEEDDVQLLMTVANHAGMALQNGRLVDRLRHDALHDGLTGLPNRSMLNQEMVAALGDLRAGRSSGMTVIVMDLVGFKQVNDTFGHHVGDRLLIQVAKRLAAELGGLGVLARLGGDEFAAVLPGLGEVSGALDISGRMRAALVNPIAIEGVDVEVGVSVGVAVAPQHGSDGQTLMKYADTAMYEAKKSGTGLELYDSGSTVADDPQKLALVAELRHGIQAGELDLYVQPQASLETGQIVGVEALVRWRHPVHGLLFPDAFIPLAERTGLIKPLTDVVFEASIAAAGRWRREGTPIGISVNLSARTTVSDDLVEQVSGLLSRHALPPESLTLEITETSVIRDPVRTGEVLRRFDALGVRLSIDDFGTGYSSMSYLRQLPVREVKVDKSFVMTMMQHPDDAAIVRSIVDLGRNLGLDVVAEGVEDAEIEAELRRMGCTLMQGFHLSPPMPVGRFDEWLAAREGRSAAGPWRERPQRQLHVESVITAQ